MKRPIIKNVALLSLILSVSVFCGCSSDEETGTPIKIFVSNYDVPSNIITSDVAITPGGPVIITDLEEKFPCRTTRPVAGATTVTLGIDNSLVDKYNQENGTSYLPLPAQALKLENTQLHLSAGNAITSDSVSIATDDLSTLEGDKVYMAPLTILSSNNGDCVTSSNRGTLYLVVNAIKTNCRNAPLAGEMSSLTLVTTKTGWSGTIVSDPQFTGNASVLFDGNTSSTTSRVYLTGYKSFDLTVDLGQTYNGITGLQLYTYSSTAYRIRTMDVYSSTDGTNFRLEGKANVSTLTTNQYVKFFSPINARYIRVNNITIGSSYFYLYEFWIFQ